MLLASGSVKLAYSLFLYLQVGQASHIHTYAITADQNLQFLKSLILLTLLILYYSEHVSCMEKNHIRVPSAC